MLNLTTEQLQLLKADMAANTNTVKINEGTSNEVILAIKDVPTSPDNAVVVAQWYNQPSTKYVWRTLVTEDEYVSTQGVDVANGDAATTFSWKDSGFITRSQGERDAWARIFRNGACNPSLPNVRQAFADIMSGSTAPAPQNRNHLTVISKRISTIGENLFATGTGNFQQPATMPLNATGLMDGENDVLRAWTEV